MNTVKMINADCLAEMAAIPDRSFPLVLTDIPYGEVNRKSNGLRSLDKRDADTASFDVAELTRTLCGKTSGSVYMFCGINQLSTIRSTMTECGLSTRVIVWEKTNPSPMNGTKIWLSGIELCAFGKRQGGGGTTDTAGTASSAIRAEGTTCTRRRSRSSSSSSRRIPATWCSTRSWEAERRASPRCGRAAGSSESNGTRSISRSRTTES